MLVSILAISYSRARLIWRRSVLYMIAMSLHGSVCPSFEVASSVVAASQGQASTRHPGWISSSLKL